MPNEKTDSAGFVTVNTDKERDKSAKGDPVTGVGVPGDKHAPANTVDTATQMAALSKKPENNDNVGEKE